MPRNFIYIINPISGRGEKSSLQKILETESKKGGFDFKILPAVANGDYSFLYDTITRQQITDVVIAGGDGTVNQVVNSLQHLNVQFGIVPFGSGNGLAFSAKIPKSTKRALEVIFEGKSKAVDAFMVNEKFACSLCGVGFDAQVAHNFANDPKRGLKTYIKQSVVNFFKARAYPVVVTAGEVEWELDAFFVSIANGNQFGNNFTIAPRASLTDGLLDIVIVTKKNKINILVQTLKQVGGFNKLQTVDVVDNNASVIYFQVPAVDIKNVNLAPIHIDGEPTLTSSLLKIQILPKHYRLTVP
ncbi:MAG: diacylglycerol kinase family protein [Chitinophagaceae bacterium]